MGAVRFNAPNSKKASSPEQRKNNKAAFMRAKVC
jgi:hypothetical protein